VADFWHAERYCGEFPMKQGISAVQVNSENGKQVMNEIISEGIIVYKKVSIEEFWYKRSQHNAQAPVGRKEFLMFYKEKGIEGLLEMYPAKTLREQITDKIRCMFKSR
jgi:hypothetical protein